MTRAGHREANPEAPFGMALPEAMMRLAISSPEGPGCLGRGRRCRRR
jgi:hypothetical protein